MALRNHDVGEVPPEKYPSATVFQMDGSKRIVIKNSNFKVSNKEYKIIYETVLKLIVKCVVPYVCMITTNLLVVRTFYNLKRKPITVCSIKL